MAVPAADLRFHDPPLQVSEQPADEGFLIEPAAAMEHTFEVTDRDPWDIAIGSPLEVESLPPDAEVIPATATVDLESQFSAGNSIGLVNATAELRSAGPRSAAAVDHRRQWNQFRHPEQGPQSRLPNRYSAQFQPRPDDGPPGPLEP